MARKQLKTRLSDVLADAQRSAVIALLREDPKLTLGEATSLGGEAGKLVKTLTMGELLSGKPNGASKVRAAPAPLARKPRKVDTRSAKGRKRYDRAVMDALRGLDRPVGAKELRGIVGGTSLQARTALNRLIEAGKVQYEGRSNATRYSLK